MGSGAGAGTPSKRASAAPREVPTLKEFAPRFLEGYVRANQHKPSGLASKEAILRLHLLPRFGARRLDEITTEDVQRLKATLVKKSGKTVNNILSVLNVLLKTAHEWEVIDRRPCAIKVVRTMMAEATFHSFEAFETLVRTARESDDTAYLIVLLGGEASLRCGEMMALESFVSRVRCSQAFQSLELTADQCFLLRSCPPFELFLALQGSTSIRVSL
jgi:hypothetical protein